MLIGRRKEKIILEELLKSPKAEFLAVYGRRRIGKTYLIHEFCKNRGFYLEVTGSHKASKSQQIKSFIREVDSLFPVDESISDWGEALHFLIKKIKTLPSDKKIILFFDEIPWLASPKSGFLTALEYAWNRHLCNMENVLLIVCGSAAHWIIQKIIKGKGGLHNRLSKLIPIAPFTLSEVEGYLISQGIAFERKQLVELYMAFGGVAKYLSGLPKGISVAQIINETCFTSTGYLCSEFPKLYESLFDSPNKHIAIVRELAKHPHGMTQSALLETTGLPSGGRSSTTLEELEEAGFIMSMPAFGKKEKEKIFRLIDEYSLFYLAWIESIRSGMPYLSDPDYWHKKYQTPHWHQWAGHAFETICLKHIAGIKQALGISGIGTRVSHWQHHPHKGESGAEIDLIIDRDDQCVHLCEMKFCSEEFTITKKVADDIERKKILFREKTGTRKTLFVTFITPYGLKENSYSIHLVNQSVTLDALFHERATS
ncbi:MAG: AAA family ATPase [Simkaniaceae bacterium]|nr:AAA family ATPase [Simkaniaceae bacterium]